MRAALFIAPASASAALHSRVLCNNFIAFACAHIPGIVWSAEIIMRSRKKRLCIFFLHCASLWVDIQIWRRQAVSLNAFGDDFHTRHGNLSF